MHYLPSPFAGITVHIKKSIVDPDVAGFGGSKFQVIDWWDRVDGKSWMICHDNPECTAYNMRIGTSKNVPIDDEVLYGRVGVSTHLVHMREIET